MCPCPLPVSGALVALAAALPAHALAAPAAGVAGRAILLAEVPAGGVVESVIVTQADDGRSLNLRRGEPLRVVLPDTAGTGYSWEIESVDRRLLRLEGQSTWQDPGPAPSGRKGAVGLVGGPLQVSFLFRAVAAGRGELLLRHWRPWEGPASVDRRFRLQLQVVE